MQKAGIYLTKFFIALFVMVLLLSILVTAVLSIMDQDEGGGLGPYETNISFQYENEHELQMIQKAENLTPLDGNAWYGEFDNIKLADCVCRESIDYYSQLIRDIEGDPDIVGITIKEAEMEYTAVVESFENDGSYNTSDSELFKVRLELSFYEYMGPLAALWYDHYRVVVMTGDLEVLDVEGDGEKESVVVS